MTQRLGFSERQPSRTPSRSPGCAAYRERHPPSRPCLPAFLAGLDLRSQGRQPGGHVQAFYPSGAWVTMRTTHREASQAVPGPGSPQSVAHRSPAELRRGALQPRAALPPRRRENGACQGSGGGSSGSCSFLWVPTSRAVMGKCRASRMWSRFGTRRAMHGCWAGGARWGTAAHPAPELPGLSTRALAPRL